MTTRKPFGVPQETWVDQLIREAEERGEFDNLPGKGKPIKGLDRPWSLDDWARDMIKREGVSILPPGLQLRRDVERELEEIMKLALEEGVRNRVARLNEHIRETNRRLHEGPASMVKPLDADDIVERWRKVRNASG
ncbi:MAG: DUF1992 domain-containing protein [Planctomycetes bacterium]|nr:DUF1992 domain-containing protein [Planctomycetota bacterium]